MDVVTPIKVDRYAQLLQESQFDKEKAQILITGFKKGFDIGYRGPVMRKDTSQNIPLTIGTHLDLWEKLMKEVDHNRLAGPFDEIPYVNHMQSPIGLVPKAGNQTRLIFHLSYNFGDEEHQKSLNHHTPEDWCKVKYNDLDHAIKTCLKLGKKASRNCDDHRWEEFQQQLGREVYSTLFYSKSDLKSAFRILPILPGQRCWLLMMAINPNNGKKVFFSDKCLPFGASISCASFTLFSDSLKHIIEHVTRRHHTVTNYLDDFLFIATDEMECNRMVRSFITLCSEIGCPLSLDKTEWASSLIIFLGLLLNGRMYTISIPIEKKLKAERLLNYAIDKKKVTVKFIQRLTGTLNFLNRAIVPGRTFTRLMYDKLKTKNSKGQLLKHYHHVNLGKEVLRDCAIWKIFLNNANSVQLCRPFVDIDAISASETLNFYTDSSLNRKLGFGGIFGNRWIVGKWGEQFIIEKEPSIEFLELYALVAGVLTWSKLMQNTRVSIFCDNQSVMHIANNHSSHCEQCMKLVRVLTIDNMRSNRRIFLKWVKTDENVLADSLSRLDFTRFWRNAPKSMKVCPDVVPSNIWPVNKIWDNDGDTLLQDVCSASYSI